MRHRLNLPEPPPVDEVADDVLRLQRGRRGPAAHRAELDGVPAAPDERLPDGLPDAEPRRARAQAQADQLQVRVRDRPNGADGQQEELRGAQPLPGRRPHRRRQGGAEGPRHEEDDGGQEHRQVLREEHRAARPALARDRPGRPGPRHRDPGEQHPGQPRKRRHGVLLPGGARSNVRVRRHVLDAGGPRDTGMERG